MNGPNNRIIDGDFVCKAVEATLRSQLPPTIERRGLHQPPAPERRFRAPKVWNQVPTLEALRASLPAYPEVTGGITSPGLAKPPVRTKFSVYDAVWRISVGIYGRGRDYNDTSARNRKWASLIRTVLINNADLGVGVTSLAWVGEEYRQIPDKQESATIAGCAVAFDIQFDDVVDLTLTDPPVVTTPTVSLTSTVTVAIQ